MRWLSLLLLLLVVPASAQSPFLPRGKTLIYTPLGADTASVSSSQVYYIVTSNGDSIYVRGSLSKNKDIIQTYGLKGPVDQKHIDIYNSHVISPALGNTLAEWRTGRMAFRDGPYASGWFSTMHGTNVMGWYSVTVPKVTSASNDKTTDDIGSYWSDGTHQWVLAEVSGASLIFYCVPYLTPSPATVRMVTSTIAGTLTHVSGATHTANITIDSQTPVYTGKPTKNASITILKNGTTPVTSGGGRANFVDLVEEFDVINPLKIVRTNNPWVWNDAPTWFHAKHVWRLSNCGAVVHFTYTMADTMIAAAIMPLNLETYAASAPWDSNYFYIPKTKSTSIYDWSSPRPLRAGYAGGTIENDSMAVSGSVADRVSLLFRKLPAATYDLGLSMGFLPIGTALDQHANAKNYYFRISSSGLIYPNLFGEYTYTPNLYSGTVLDGYIYYQWSDPESFGATKNAYWNAAAGHDYVYLDYFASATSDATVLPGYMAGQAIAVVDTFQTTIAESTVPRNGVIHVTTNPGKTKGFAVLKLTAP